ncbi:MAG: adenosylcobinamide-phosphate synthase CbiB [Prevotella sp.]
MDIELILLIAVLTGWCADRLLGDPAWLPHPVVMFGRLIAFGEKKLNKGSWRRTKGAVLAIGLVLSVFVVTGIVEHLLYSFNQYCMLAFDAIIIFFCLAGKTLSREVRDVFLALDCSLEKGRRQVARIVGRDTSRLSGNEVRTAALETLAENLSDGVVAPLFWFVLLGVPGMLTYKMINTLDSMIGYRTSRYARFGTFAARLDDIANYIPARLTAWLMIIVAGRLDLFAFVMTNSSHHASPNSGWPESALAGILGCSFGGPHTYFGETIDKPYIGNNERQLTTADMYKALSVNKKTEILVVALLVIAVLLLFTCKY